MNNNFSFCRRCKKKFLNFKMKNDKLSTTCPEHYKSIRNSYGKWKRNSKLFAPWMKKYLDHSYF